MITKIILNKVASYKNQTALITDKKVNLIYGLNGTGKSTLSNYLHQRTDDRFKNCSIEGLDDDHEILVYNQTFIQENFFEAENLKGIFTLSKVNKEAVTKIANALKEIKKLEEDKVIKNAQLETEKSSINQKQETAKNEIWKIKTDYSGGDRVLEFCLDGYKGSKDNLFNHIVGLAKPTAKPTKSIEDLKNDLQSISGDNAQKYSLLSQITFPSQSIETEALFSKQIVGNENSTVSQLIKELGNSDWVKAGLQYLPKEEIQENSTCPFCQEKTISDKLIESIKNYFDATYEADINSLKAFLDDYIQAIQSIPNKAIFEANPKFETLKKDFEIKYNVFTKVVEDNKKLIEDKIKTPSVSVTLKSSTKALEELNEVIQKINLLVSEHNKNIDQITAVKSNIKSTFWEIMRWDYDHTISGFNVDKVTSKRLIDVLDTSLEDTETKIKTQNAIISKEQKQTVNIDDAIVNIKNGLVDLGITDFEIKKHTDNLYKIVRGENEDKVFRSLSEGEKMIISFLYFLELCGGKKEATEVGKKKIVVIDDPISSLSHIYIFNVGRLIHNEFLRNDKYEQVFLLTHSLYFLYEMTDTNKERRKENQKLFRLRKISNGSEILEMSYEEIQNDYHSYWFIVKDDQQPAALIANCMRNIIEYFFNFVEKKDLNNVFQKPSMQENRFQAFCRYINRESHSLGQNIFDIKEFNYNDFKDAFALVFKENGYEEHYKRMIK
ncbi:AAA family ATPase [Sphingobacterium sp. BN32]|uniref:AAA family ATPase n=1 Tax=Sphingobacterium sp. BN32 TaxID=3058432 RepID=UPI00265D06B7|nr:AAA family ATPase [Sphingobacterium sp. BN32]WKK60357.1 AAA family ATPase [Sphingobacterium sp. BN32]